MLNLGGYVLGLPSETVPVHQAASRAWPTPSASSPATPTSWPCATLGEGAPLRASWYSRIPVINAGDGGHQHLTQTMTDPTPFAAGKAV